MKDFAVAARCECPLDAIVDRSRRRYYAKIEKTKRSVSMRMKPTEQIPSSRAGLGSSTARTSAATISTATSISARSNAILTASSPITAHVHRMS